MTPIARFPSPTIRVEEGDRLKINLRNTHYFPHTIHPHGTIHPNAMDGVPDITQAAVKPGENFAYEFVAKNPGTFFYHCHVQPDVHVLMVSKGCSSSSPTGPATISATSLWEPEKSRTWLELRRSATTGSTLWSTRTSTIS